MHNYETNKLFYKKYLYKLDIRNSMATYFREKKFSEAREVIDILQKKYESRLPLDVEFGMRIRTIPESDFLDAQKLLSLFVNTRDDFKLRVSFSYISIYSNSKDWLYGISSTIRPNSVISFHAPNPKYQDLLAEDIILIDEDNGYKFRVTLGRKSGDPNFANWASKNSNQVKIGPILKEALLDQGFVDGMYFYARDEKTLQLCSLLTNNIRRIDKLIVKSNIDK